MLDTSGIGMERGTSGLHEDQGMQGQSGDKPKTTLELYEAVHVVLGCDLYGSEIVKSGPRCWSLPPRTIRTGS